MPKILLTHTPEMREKYYGDRALQALRSMAELLLHDGVEPLSADALIAAAKGADLVIADRLTEAPAKIFASVPTLHAFLRCAVDIRNIDVAAASSAGVLVTRARPGFVASTVELALGLMIDLARGISRSAGAYHAGLAPGVQMGRQLAGSAIGIIGYGSIGRALAPVAAALGMTVLVADPFVTVDNPNIIQMPMAALLTQSDFVVCLAIATAETENLMNATAFGKMKRTAYFINISRGNLVDETALADALAVQRIAGAALDVGRAPDQMPSLALAGMPNVIATPHIGGLTPPAIESQAMDTVGQVAALLRGEIPEGAVNADRWTRRF
ncbi:NAD(P)-dependent oxidoreductase [Acidisphaera sp. L21]|uniref:NAD(P)-dependent oxidoreductase n=1 Tax=Acidisphaera sp. L21 TaxID=1641851 RepID=UPI00131D75E1|nr:NAD(P)-dependent oxidoreductase [Acidisphaera sp. L21]